MKSVPRLAGGKPAKGKNAKPAKGKKAPKSTPKRGRSHDVEQADEVVVAGVTPVAEEPSADEVKQMPAVEQAVPFSDGIVAPCLANLVVIPRVGGQEVDLLKSFLKYFGITETFIGAISSKTSFMKRKGGMLL